ncbi:hypothetical protein [Hamadaea tsunoensis]|uniref:hypothetical protein n=1 Tax=Hamadaea tsunoensis TaxID=53368 RepID=UPI000412B244|nr:hypothetical protein [Hamadaea tsunoensis]
MAARDQVELAILEDVDRYNHRRPHSVAADLPPADFETLYDPDQTRHASDFAAGLRLHRLLDTIRRSAGDPAGSPALRSGN